MERNIEREKLINEIISFCFKHGVLDASDNVVELTNIIESKLKEAPFIENLINTIIIKARACEGVDIEKVKNLLLELEKIRLELEFKSYNIKVIG